MSDIEIETVDEMMKFLGSIYANREEKTQDRIKAYQAALDMVMSTQSPRFELELVRWWFEGARRVANASQSEYLRSEFEYDCRDRREALKAEQNGTDRSYIRDYLVGEVVDEEENSGVPGEAPRAGTRVQLRAMGESSEAGTDRA